MWTQYLLPIDYGPYNFRSQCLSFDQAQFTVRIALSEIHNSIAHSTSGSYARFKRSWSTRKLNCSIFGFVFHFGACEFEWVLSLSLFIIFLISPCRHVFCTLWLRNVIKCIQVVALMLIIFLLKPRCRFIWRLSFSTLIHTFTDRWNNRFLKCALYFLHWDVGWRQTGVQICCKIGHAHVGALWLQWLQMLIGKFLLQLNTFIKICYIKTLQIW